MMGYLAKQCKRKQPDWNGSGVLCVPAYWHGMQRKLMQEAGMHAFIKIIRAQGFNM